MKRTRRFWSEKEDLQLIDLYGKYSDEHGNFLEYKMEDGDRIGGRTFRAHSARLENVHKIRCLRTRKTDPANKSHRGRTAVRAQKGMIKIDRAQIAKMYVDGLSYRQIAEDLNIGRETIRRYINKYLKDSEVQTPHLPVSREKVRKAMKYTRQDNYNQQWTDEEVAALVDMANNHVSNNGTICWSHIPDSEVMRSRSAMIKRWSSHIRPLCRFDKKNFKWVLKNQKKNPNAITPNNKVESPVKKVSKRMERKTYLWGLYTIEKVVND